MGSPQKKQKTHDEKDTEKKLNFNHVFQEYKVDNLYHLGLDTCMPLQKWFGDVQTVCMMGSPTRVERLAQVLTDEFHQSAPLANYSKTDRCNLFKVGRVVVCSHGMAGGSCSIFLHEISKLLFHAKADLKNIGFIRLGTSGGVGVKAGSVVLTKQGRDGCTEPGFEHIALGQRTRVSSIADAALNAKILAANKGKLDYDLTEGDTMATNDYYDSQGRRDGALPVWYSDEDKVKFLKEAYNKGIRNIDMETALFLAFFSTLGVSASVVNTALLDRMECDQHTQSKEVIKAWSLHSQDVLLNYLRTL